MISNNFNETKVNLPSIYSLEYEHWTIGVIAIYPTMPPDICGILCYYKNIFYHSQIMLLFLLVTIRKIKQI